MQSHVPEWVCCLTGGMHDLQPMMCLLGAAGYSARAA